MSPRVANRYTLYVDGRKCRVVCHITHRTGRMRAAAVTRIAPTPHLPRTSLSHASELILRIILRLLPTNGSG